MSEFRRYYFNIVYAKDVITIKKLIKNINGSIECLHKEIKEAQNALKNETSDKEFLEEALKRIQGAKK